MRKILISDVQSKIEHAGFKAKRDVREICSSLDIQIIDIHTHYSIKTIDGIYKFILNTIQLAQKLNKNDIVFINYPIYSRFVIEFLFLIQKKYNLKIVPIIHDLDSLRGHVGIDEKYLSNFKYMISHNKKMSEYLIRKYPDIKIVNLEVFDYLVRNNPSYTFESTDHPYLVFAGNLSQEKSGFLYHYKLPVKSDLWGINLDVEKINLNSLTYIGKFDPDNPEKFFSHYQNKNVFGLIWDGTDIDSCNGEYGEYLKYNNPHKTSFYLSQGLPVIIWKQAALADFVVENKCGLIVDSLSELPDVFNHMDSDIYKIYRQNAEIIGEKIRRGYFLSKSIKAIEKLICNQ
ncbi:MAG: hypothetical protein LKF82_14465 [Acinetobacter populi]|jgi:hypothetical protein|uniref:hypothetical protein n=1 Tax=Acinetobacter populi TaxID=1582270 RepID=UPI00235407AC|nr:hypothetical protein [Acinetobacter populi]MCH4249002.1 hypothetical protein [Acinetobacter populi]